MAATHKLTKTEQKEKAQVMLMHGIGNVLGYWSERSGDEIPLEQHEEFHAIMLREADRIARMFGFEKAWCN